MPKTRSLALDANRRSILSYSALFTAQARAKVRILCQRASVSSSSRAHSRRRHQAPAPLPRATVVRLWECLRHPAPVAAGAIRGQLRNTKAVGTGEGLSALRWSTRAALVGVRGKLMAGSRTEPPRI